MQHGGNHPKSEEKLTENADLVEPSVNGKCRQCGVTQMNAHAMQYEDGNGDGKRGPGLPIAQRPLPHLRLLLQSSCRCGREYKKVDLPVGPASGKFRIEKSMRRTDLLDNKKHDPCRRQHRQPKSTHEEQKERQQDIEMFFYSQCPEMSLKKSNWRYSRMPHEVLEHEHRRRPVVPAIVDDMNDHQRCNRRQVNHRRRLDAEDATNVKLPDVEKPFEPFLLKNAGSNEYAADGEEKIDAVASPGLDIRGGITCNRPRRIMRHHHSEDRQRPPAIERWKIPSAARFHLRLH